jgi:exopolysaccharide biosynthesis WecB/TagA/CpsF family protein
MSITSDRPPALATVDGWPINVADQRQAVAEIIAAAKGGESFAAFTLNLDHIVKLRRERRFREAYDKARFITADGAPVAWLASQQGTRIERTTGADLLVPLAQAAAREGVPIYLFGTTAGVLARAGLELAQRTDFALDIAGTAAPERGFNPEGPAADAALARIAASGARLCFVALGAPKQEILAAKAVEKGIGVGFVCIGAALDFLVGAQLRAPKVMQTYGLEWLWRLATNPGRLAGRYASCALVLAGFVLLTPLNGLIPRHRP